MKVACIIIAMTCSVAVFAKDKETFHIEVVGTDAWQRDIAIHHAGTNSTSTSFRKVRDSSKFSGMVICLPTGL